MDRKSYNFYWSSSQLILKMVEHKENIKDNCNSVQQRNKFMNSTECQKVQNSEKGIDNVISIDILDDSDDDTSAQGKSNDNPKLFCGKTKKKCLELLENMPQNFELYDYFKKVRTVDNKTLETVVDLKKLDIKNDLNCPICLGIFQRTVVIKSCMHRFCAECIEKCLGIGLKQCPQCRVHVVSRRSLRYDVIFDQIVKRIFANVKEFECNDFEILEAMNRRCSYRYNYTKNSIWYPDDRHGDTIFKNKRQDFPSSNFDTVESGRVADQSSIPGVTPFSRKLKVRRQWVAKMKKFPSNGLLKFMFLHDPSLDDLPQLVPNRMKTRGDISVEHLCINLAKRIDLNSKLRLLLYTKKVRYPFKMEDTLAYLHQKSLGLSFEELIVYYTTRSEDEIINRVATVLD